MCQGCNIGLDSFGRSLYDPEDEEQVARRERANKRQREEDEAHIRRVMRAFEYLKPKPLPDQMCMFEGVGIDVTMSVVCPCRRCAVA